MANTYSKIEKGVEKTLNVKGNTATVTANTAEAKKSIDAVNKSNERQAYRNYKASKRAVGNASQTTISKLGTSYAKAVATGNTATANANSVLDNSDKVAKATIKTAGDKVRGSTNATIRNAKVTNTANDKYNKNRQKLSDQAKEMKVWKDTAPAYDTKKKANKAIKKLKGSNDPLKAEKIAYIRAGLYKAQYEKAMENARKSGGSGGGGRGGYGGYRRYGRSYGYGGSGSSSGGEELTPRNTNNIGEAVGNTVKNAVVQTSKNAKKAVFTKAKKKSRWTPNPATKSGYYYKG